MCLTLKAEDFVLSGDKFVVYKVARKNSSGPNKDVYHAPYRKTVIPIGRYISDRQSVLLSPGELEGYVSSGIHVFIDKEMAEAECADWDIDEADEDSYVVLQCEAKQEHLVAEGWFNVTVRQGTSYKHVNANSAVFTEITVIGEIK